jgi:hypothetical protein
LRRLSLDLTGVPTIYDVSGALVWTTDVNMNGWSYQRAFDSSLGTNPMSVNYFRTSGHWLFAWVAGWLGAAIAVSLRRRSAG